MSSGFLPVKERSMRKLRITPITFVVWTKQVLKKDQHEDGRKVAVEALNIASWLTEIKHCYGLMSLMT